MAPAAPAAPSIPAARQPSGIRGMGPVFDWCVTFSAACLVTGIYLDGWAHIRGMPESFFTPWHALIYGSFGFAGLLLAGEWVSGRRRGHTWRTALPPGYGLSLLGVGIFLVSGVADLVWHTIFGIESDLEALYSPPHLLLAGGGALIATGPLRAAWKSSQNSAASLWRAVISTTLLLAIFTFFTAELHPFVHPWAWTRFEPLPASPSALGLPPLVSGGVGARELAATLGVGSFILQAALLTALALLLIRRWGVALPAGWLTFLLGSSTAGLSLFHWTPWTIPVAILGGAAGDVLYRRLKPTTEAPLRLRGFAAVLPAILFSLYFVALFLQGGVWWAIHVWLGAIALSAITAWLVTYLLLPPAMPEPREAPPAGGRRR